MLKRMKMFSLFCFSLRDGYLLCRSVLYPLLKYSIEPGTCREDPVRSAEIKKEQSKNYFIDFRNYIQTKSTLESEYQFRFLDPKIQYNIWRDCPLTKKRHRLP
jgi:hypothetical protein